ncbi:hypothetical protein ABH905_004059 [Pseudomonas frederiksbergensis]
MTLADLQRLSVSQSELVLPYLHAIKAADNPSGDKTLEHGCNQTGDHSFKFLTR